MGEANNNYGAIENQFETIRNYIIREENPMNLENGYSKLNISESLKNPEGIFKEAMVNALFTPLFARDFHCLNEENNKNELMNFVFGFDQNNFDTFLGNEQIDARDKFFALVTKYAIISRLPDEFKDVRDKEMDLLYNHIEEVSKNCTKYVEENKLIEGNSTLSDSLMIITDDIFSINNKTDYDKDIKFITDIYKNMPLLTKDRIIHFQGEPGFNRLIHGFLDNPHKNDDIVNFLKNTIQNDPSCIYKFATGGERRNNKYEQIEKNKDFSGNFICNFPGVLNENGDINYEETRCKCNVLSDILYTLNYKEIPESVKEDIKQMLNTTLKSLSNHIKSLRESNNLEELQKINYLLNCPIKYPNTEKIVTPEDLIGDLKWQGIINLTKEQMGQFRIEPVCLLGILEMRGLIETKRIEKQNKIEELKNELKTKKSTIASKFLNFFGGKTKREEIIEEEIERMEQTKLSEQHSNFFNGVKEEQLSEQNIPRPRSRRDRFANRGNNEISPFS